MLLIGFLTLAGGNGVSGCFAVFYSTLLAEFAWSHAAGASVYAVNMLMLAASAPLIGRLLDRYGPRWVFTAAAACCGLALMACSTLHTVGEFLLYYGVLSAVGQTALAPVAIVVSKWFEPARRGRVIGLVDVGTGAGMVVCVPGSAWLIAHLGWRPAFLIFGGVIMAVLIPLNLWQRPPPEPLHTSTPPARLTGVFKNRALRRLCLTHWCMTLTMTMVTVHLVEFLVSSGQLPRLGASTVLSAVSLVSLGGRMFFGWLTDRVHSEGAFSVAMSCTVFGYGLLILLALTGQPWLLYAFVLAYGFAQGAGGITVAAQTVALFQGPRVGTMFMIVNLSANLGAACGAWGGGRLFDATGSYLWTFIIAMVSGVCAIRCMWSVRRQPAARPV